MPTNSFDDYIRKVESVPAEKAALDEARARYSIDLSGVERTWLKVGDTVKFVSSNTGRAIFQSPDSGGMSYDRGIIEELDEDEAIVKVNAGGAVILMNTDNLVRI